MTVPTRPRVLLLETSGRTGFVALALEHRVLGLRRLEESRRQARDVAPHTAALLAEQRWRPCDLHGIVVSLGPGSYTGLRVGLISAKVFAYATGCPLVGIPIFPVLAHQAPADARRIEVLADAQKDKVYHQAFERLPTGELQPLGDLAVLSWEDWAANCPPGSVVTGPGALKVPDRLPPDILVLPAPEREPTPESLLALGLRRLLRGEHDDPFALDPLYLRPSSAEEQWDARKAGTLPS